MLFPRKTLHHLQSAQSFLHDLIQIRSVVLRPARGPTNSAAQFHRRDHNNGQHRQTEQGHFPILTEHHKKQGDGRKHLPKPIGKNMGRRHLNFVNVVEDGTHQLARSVLFKKGCVLMQNMVKHLGPNIRHHLQANTIDQVISQVIGNSTHQKSQQNRRCHHAPNFVQVERQNIIQENFVPSELENLYRFIGYIGRQNVVDYWAGQRHNQSVSSPGHRHQQHADRQQGQITNGIAEQPFQLPFLNCSTAHQTRSTEI